jgi:hypothetical protein
MEIQDLGAVGEFVSSMAIVITLIFARSMRCERKSPSGALIEGALSQ